MIFGHYWRRGVPEVIAGGRLACIDYSIARGGKLVAYRWEGESQLTNRNLIAI